MIVRILFVIATSLAATLAIAAGAKQDYSIKLLITDSIGNPVEKAQADTMWMPGEDGKLAPAQYADRVSDSRGELAVTMALEQFPAWIAVYNPNRTEASFAVIPDAEATKSVIRVQLKPVAKLTFTAEDEEGQPVGGVGFMIMSGSQRPTYWGTTNAGTVPLPEGKYNFQGYGAEYSMVVMSEVTIKSGETHDLGKLVFTKLPWVKNAGKPAMPLSFAEVRGLPNDFKLTDLKGKWVLLEFWGFW